MPYGYLADCSLFMGCSAQIMLHSKTSQRVRPAWLCNFQDYPETAGFGTDSVFLRQENGRLFFQVSLYVDRDLHILVDHEAAVLHDLVPRNPVGEPVNSG